ncbi:Regulatory-associated protein of mTOR [Halotydeus destructor]|nr:Regulatory-associated protein of mTOR [Halotydeus destructor]
MTLFNGSCSNVKVGHGRAIDGKETNSDEGGVCEARSTACFEERRFTETIEGAQVEEQTWRLKERMKTVSVALVLCLNVGVDPPDIIKTQPCAKLEAWIDPLAVTPQKALEAIGQTLQKQYERWQPRARYKQSLDPTVDEVKKLCVTLRRNAKDERVLFHYNGHGVPKPTANGEIWVFNRDYTQYIPLSLYDLQHWLGSPAIYVYDCSGAGQIVETFNQFALQHEREYERDVAAAKVADGKDNSQVQMPLLAKPNYRNCIQLAACASDQILPMNPDLPADLFTACLTTPIKVALQWFVMQNSSKLLPSVTLELLDKIPGQLTDRRTMLGELNWIFTAITDTIAWNVLPRKLFQQLFRQDLLVASLFRNFLLADRIMRSYNCTPVSSPKLPSTCHHPMWQAWDLTVDHCLTQLPDLVSDKDYPLYRHSSFFSEQLTAFQVWLQPGNHKGQPEQLPIVLQVLLSQVHRLRALHLLGDFLDLGPWAVNLALSVGIFPYVLKLLQSSARELRPLLVFIWSKVLSVDRTCQIDLVRDNGHKYFLAILSDTCMPIEYRAMGAFVMASVVRNFRAGQEAALQGNLIATCLEQLNDSYPLLRQWLALCLGLTWEGYDQARWCGVRDTAHEKLYSLLDDDEPEVRASAVYALGTFLNSAAERTDQANSIDQGVGMRLKDVTNDGSVIVRKELLVALQWIVLTFDKNFAGLLYQTLEDQDRSSPKNGSSAGTPPSNGLNIRKPSYKIPKAPNSSFNNNNMNLYANYGSGDTLSPTQGGMTRIPSATSLANSFSSSSIGSVYNSIWRAILQLANDPYPEIATMAQSIIDEIKKHVIVYDCVIAKQDPSYSEPSSPSLNPAFTMSESPPTVNSSRQQPRTWSESSSRGQTPSTPHVVYTPYARKRTIFGREPSINEDEVSESSTSPRKPIVTTKFVDWSVKQFCNPPSRQDDGDAESDFHHQKEWRSIRNVRARAEAKLESSRLDTSRLEDRLFHQRNANTPQVVGFHPFDPHLVVAERDTFSVWQWDSQAPNGKAYSPTLLGTHSNLNPPNSRLTSVQILNPHDSSLLMLGSDDGCIRVWSLYGSDMPQPKLVTAFQLFPDMPHAKGSGVITHWDQNASLLFAGGDSKVLKVWDSASEKKLQEINVGSECGVTTLSGDEGNLICAGCRDGSVRIFDRRLNDARIITYREHQHPIVGSHIFSDKEKHVSVLSGSSNGDVRFWDRRILSSVKHMQVAPLMTSMAIHPTSDIFACGVSSAIGHSINVFTLDGFAGSVVSHYDGFIGQRIAQVTTLSFHPFKVLLAAGSVDSAVSIFSPRAC